MSIESHIELAEQRFIPSLELFFNSVYAGIKLPSHGIDHHRRVWKYAKELLQYIHHDEYSESLLFVEKLLIACYLHDTGLTIEPGEKHGSQSRKICEKFLSKNKLNKSDYEDVLYAVENHDNKEHLNTKLTDRMLLILSAADDLDAFGYIGIYRYVEIYLARGIPPDKIGQMARENAAKRFSNFRLHFNRYPELVKKHQERYLVLDKFFEGFCKEIDSNP